MADWLVGPFIFWIICAILTGWIARRRGLDGVGVWLFMGFALGPIGVLLSLTAKTR